MILPALNPTVTSSGSGQICFGDSLLLQSPNAAGLNVQWLRNGTAIGGATDSILTASSSGSYQVIFSNGPNCPDTSAAFSVTVLSPLVADAGPDKTLCADVDSTTIGGLPTGSGSLPPYSYVWTGPALGNSSSPNPSVAPSANSSYLLTVIDGAGCESTDTVLVAVNPLLVVQAGNDTVLCQGQQVVLGGNPSGSGGSGGFSYAWSPAGGLSSSTAANPTASPSGSGSYVLTVQDAAGCDASDTVIVNLHPALFADAGADTMVCEGISFTLGGTPAASGGDGPYSYTWSPSTGLNSPTLANPAASLSSSTTYTLTVQDFNNCAASSDIQVTVESAPTAGFSFVTNQGQADFTDLSANADSVFWDFGDGNTSSQLNPSHTYAASGTYTACQYSYNDCGADTSCQSVNVVVIGLASAADIQPTAYPNPNDGNFKLELNGFPMSELLVRDAFGRVVYRMRGNEDGHQTLAIELLPLSAGVYTLVLRSAGGTATQRLVIE